MLIALGDVYAQIPRREHVSKLMRANQARVREQPGCVSFVFAETLDDPGHFVIIELWRDQAALDEHYRSQAFADYQGGSRSNSCAHRSCTYTRLRGACSR